MTKQTAHQTTINDLPVEMMDKILRDLPLEDLVRLKMTSKRLLEVVSDSRLRKLGVDAHKATNSIDHCHPNLFLVQFTKSTLLGLQHLTLDSQLQNFDLNQLNRFTRLTQLKIGYELKEENRVCLDLPGLIVLAVACNRKCSIRICSAKLQRLTYYGGGRLLQVEHPEAVLTLDTDLSQELLKPFRNVRHLSSSTNLRILSQSTLLDMPDLEEIAYSGSLDDVFRAFEYDESREWEDRYDLLPFLERFMERKKALKGAAMKVQFVSFELVDHKPIRDYKFAQFFTDYDDRSHGSFDELCLYAHNYDQIIGTVDFPYLNYLEFMQEFNFRIPADFFRKIVNIKSVRFSNIGTEKERLWFLKNLPQLNELEVGLYYSSETFFRRLSEVCSSTLRSLIISLEPSQKLPTLNFPVEFKALDSLEFKWRNLSLEEIRWLLSLSWSSKTEFHLKFQRNCLYFGVMRHPDSKEAFLYKTPRGHFGANTQKTTLQTCALVCLSQLVEYFESHPASNEDAL